MNNLEIIKVIGASMGGAVGYLFGGFDTMLIVLIAMTGIDIASGFLAGAYLQEINSNTGYRGIIKKIGIYLIVALANLIDVALGTNILRGAVIGFYIAMEGISIIENWGKMGLPLPAALVSVLEQLQEKAGVKEAKKQEV